MALWREGSSISTDSVPAVATATGDGEPAARTCVSCRGKGWRFVRGHRANAESRVNGEPVRLRRVACFDCPDPTGEAA